jgi:2-keto-4-pentenoate hydratase/2-oxohepta-3-ene-1,7-dioic acid hydratase in catechol pathway
VRFIKAATAAGPRIGVLRDDDVVELSETASRIEEYIGDDGEMLAQLANRIAAAPGEEIPVEELDLLRPVDPLAMRDFMIFEEHVLPAWRESGLTRGPDVWYEQPVGYLSNVANILGPREAVEMPGGTQRLDFELEVGAILGRAARSVTPEQAAAYIAGFTVLCDWTARDIQFREMDGRLGPFKGKDFASSLGPVFVTPDELADRRSGAGYDLTMRSTVNGRVYGTDKWSSAYWSFEELVSYASWNACVEAGSLIGSGTCQGGCILELALRHGGEEYPWLTTGDEVCLSVELLGEIRATVGTPARGAWPGLRTLAET